MPARGGPAGETPRVRTGVRGEDEREIGGVAGVQDGVPEVPD